jgi:hypothetical protein
MLKTLEDKTVLLAFRADDVALLPRLAAAAAAIGLGAVVTLGGALSLQFKIAHAVQVGCAIAGSALILGGLVSAFVALPRSLRHERCMFVRRDGLLFELTGGEPVFVAWADVERVCAREDALVVCKRDGSEHVVQLQFGGMAQIDLARAVEQQRMRVNLQMV